eukprot:1448268-Rhodomonas_salina.2
MRASDSFQVGFVGGLQLNSVSLLSLVVRAWLGGACTDSEPSDLTAGGGTVVGRRWRWST